MKILLSVFLGMGLQIGIAQQLTILPSNPTSTDTIYVISDFTYSGNCAFGLVHYSVYVTQDILILPTYCGHGDTTVCNSIDTFVVPPVAAGNYNIIVEYHQGSVCPASGFDTTLDTAIAQVNISGSTGMPEMANQEKFSIYPNPVNDNFNLKLSQQGRATVTVKNICGTEIFRYSEFSGSIIIDASLWNSGIYLVEVIEDDKFSSKHIVVY